MNAANYVDAAVDAEAVLDALRAIYGADVFLEHGIISDFYIRGDRFPLPFNFPLAGTNPHDSPTLPTFNTVLFNLVNSGIFFNKFHYRGIFDDQLVGRAWVPDGGTTTAIATYYSALRDKCKIKVQVRPTTVPPVYQFPPIVTTVTDFKVRERKDGRPFGLDLGRRTIR
jgi:hypothetical protein